MKIRPRDYLTRDTLLCQLAEQRNSRRQRLKSAGR